MGTKGCLGGARDGAGLESLNYGNSPGPAAVGSQVTWGLSGLPTEPPRSQ